jgi:hypothetical protein
VRAAATNVLVLGLLVALFALARGRLAWARITSRKVAGAWAAALFLAVGVVAPQQLKVAGTGETHSPASLPAATPTPEATVDVSTEPTPLEPTPEASTSLGTPATGPAGVVTAQSQPDAASARQALDRLPIKGRAPKTGYTRDQFGQGWYDQDRNGCDTRNDILRRDLVRRVMKAGTNGCKVLQGDAAPDKYTGQLIHFEYGGASEIDIDHVVALSDAWQKGAQQLTFERRRMLANDPLNLLAVSASQNRQKGDADAASWLPANKAYRCRYVARQVAVKVRYSLWVTEAEHTAIARVLAACPNEPLPTAGAVPLDRTSPTAAGTSAPPSAAPLPSPQPPATQPPSGVTSYPNCDAMHVDYPHGVGRPGATDHTSGKPVTNFEVNEDVYNANTARDGDKDGIACEKA